MSIHFRRIALLVVALAACPPLSAQGVLGQILQPKTPANSPPKTGTDPLSRETPYGTLYGFLEAAQAGNYSIAAQYLQMSPARRQAQGEDFATKLKLVIDRAFTGDLRRI